MLENESDCIFCKIINGEIPSTKVFEDEQILAFKDIDPQAPHHIVIIPKAHIPSTNEIKPCHLATIGYIFEAIAKIAKQEGFADSGYRVVNNCGEDGGQTVGHLHFHVLAGRNLEWPPG